MCPAPSHTNHLVRVPYAVAPCAWISCFRRKMHSVSFSGDSPEMGMAVHSLQGSSHPWSFPTDARNPQPPEEQCHSPTCPDSLPDTLGDRRVRAGPYRAPAPAMPSVPPVLTLSEGLLRPGHCVPF